MGVGVGLAEAEAEVLSEGTRHCEEPPSFHASPCTQRSCMTRSPSTTSSPALGTTSDAMTEPSESSLISLISVSGEVEEPGEGWGQGEARGQGEG